MRRVLFALMIALTLIATGIWGYAVFILPDYAVRLADSDSLTQTSRTASSGVDADLPKKDSTSRRPDVRKPLPLRVPEGVVVVDDFPPSPSPTVKSAVRDIPKDEVFPEIKPFLSPRDQVKFQERLDMNGDGRNEIAFLTFDPEAPQREGCKGFCDESYVLRVIGESQRWEEVYREPHTRLDFEWFLLSAGDFDGNGTSELLSEWRFARTSDTYIVAWSKSNFSKVQGPYNNQIKSVFLQNGVGIKPTTFLRFADGLFRRGFSIYREENSMCCPTGGEVLITYQFTGDGFTVLEELYKPYQGRE